MEIPAAIICGDNFSLWLLSVILMLGMMIGVGCFVDRQQKNVLVSNFFQTGMPDRADAVTKSGSGFFAEGRLNYHGRAQPDEYNEVQTGSPRFTRDELRE
ncbi:MAG: hypothetical protein AB1568_15275 [Thermodesulfobacteriota bacterium]